MWNPAVISLVLLSFVLGTCEFIIIGIVPDIADSLSVPLTQAGMLISWFALSYAVGTPLISVWGSRFPRYHFILWLTALFALGNGLTLFVEDYGFFLADRIFLAVLSGVLISVSITFAPDIAPRKYLPSVVSWIFAGFSIASVFGVPLGTLAAAYISWKYIFAFIALVTVVNFFMMFRSLPSKANATKPVSMAGQFSLLADKRILLGMGSGIGSLAGSYCWYAYITPVLTDVMGVAFAWVSPFLFLFGAATIVSNLSSGRVAAAGGTYVLWPLLAVQAVVTGSLLFSIHFMWFGLATILLLGIFIYIHNASLQIYFLHISSVFHPGTTLMSGALLPTAANTGIALGTAAGSFTADATGLSWLPLPGAIFLGLSAFCCWLLMKPERDRLKRICFRS